MYHWRDIEKKLMKQDLIIKDRRTRRWVRKAFTSIWGSRLSRVKCGCEWGEGS